MDQKSLNFHIKSQDYFGTLATIFSLLTQGVIDDKNRDKIINEKVEELMYLQNNCKIIKKNGFKPSNKEYR